MDEKTQVHVQVDEETKREWKRYADEDPENHNGTLSLLIKRAVQHEINDQHGEDRGTKSVRRAASDVTDQQAKTEKELAKLRETVNQMDSRVEEIQREVTSDTEKRPLKERLWEALPPAYPNSEKWSRTMDIHRGAPAIQWATAWSGELEEICKRVGENPVTVKEKLDEMGVPREETNDSTIYWMEGQL